MLMTLGTTIFRVRKHKLIKLDKNTNTKTNFDTTSLNSIFVLEAILSLE